MRNTLCQASTPRGAQRVRAWNRILDFLSRTHNTQTSMHPMPLLLSNCIAISSSLIRSISMLSLCNLQCHLNHQKCFHILLPWRNSLPHTMSQQHPCYKIENGLSLLEQSITSKRSQKNAKVALEK
jgi:hypothetical protein